MSTLKVNNIQSTTDGSVTFPQGSISSQPVTFPSGNASNPSISFTGDTDTGLYRIDANKIGISSGGNKVLELDPNTFSTFQGGVEKFRIASNGQISSVIPNGNTLYNGFMCRAWVNFDGTLSGTITPRGSGNVSSVTRNSLGVYTITFLNPMPDVNYCIAGTCNYDTNGWGTVTIHSANNGNVFSVNNIIIRTVGYANIFDSAFVCVAVFR